MVINALRGGHTDTETHQRANQKKQFQEARCAWPLAVCTWFNKLRQNYCFVGLYLSFMEELKGQRISIAYNTKPCKCA